jgi:hypothetical protein
MSADCPEYPPLTDAGRCRPMIDSLLDPHGHGHRPYAFAFAYQIYDGPVSLPVLHIFHSQRGQLRLKPQPSNTATMARSRMLRRSAPSAFSKSSLA